MRERCAVVIYACQGEELLRVEIAAYIFACWLGGGGGGVVSRHSCHCRYIFTCLMSRDVHLLKRQIWYRKVNRIADATLYETKACILVSR
jgi:hypothetical protein